MLRKKCPVLVDQYNESVWRDNGRRHTERIPLMDVLHKYSADYKVVFIGDASMSPYEIAQPGGSVEHWNEEPGYIWFKRLSDVYEKVVWINPVDKKYWEYTQSIAMCRELLKDHMYPMTVHGLEEAMSYLSK